MTYTFQLSPYLHFRITFLSRRLINTGKDGSLALLRGVGSRRGAVVEQAVGGDGDSEPERDHEKPCLPSVQRRDGFSTDPRPRLLRVIINAPKPLL